MAVITDRAIQWLRLSMLRGIGPVQGRKLVRAVGDIESLWSATAESLLEIDGIGEKLLAALHRCEAGPAENIATYCLKHDIWLICQDDDCWPDSLRAIEDAPLVLFVRGDAGYLQQAHLLAVVGARRASREGQLLTRRWCRYFSDRGVTVVSGMAYGIDAAAHAGTLEGISPTIAVLGGGLSCLSEQQQQQVAAIIRQGCVISEFLPEAAPRPEFFPRRNRIIAGLAEATLVMEADLRSGSLITARQAADYGRDVLAVPGSVLAGNHDGCHQLIRDGAILAARAEDVLEHMGWAGNCRSSRSYAPATDEEARLLRILGRESMHVDMLAESCGLTMSRLSPILLRLELDGVVERLPGSRYLLAVELRET